MTTTERPTMDMTLLATAFVMSERGTCSRARVGCVVALDGRILSSAYNGAPRGMPHCVHDDRTTDDFGPSEPTCPTGVHAEANAVAFAARYGVSLDGSVLYTTLSPCVPCAQLIVNVGIERVVCAKVYRDTTGVELLLSAGLTVDVLSDQPGETFRPPVVALSEDELVEDDGGA
jgi:dCMP deaminase